MLVALLLIGCMPAPSSTPTPAQHFITAMRCAQVFFQAAVDLTCLSAPTNVLLLQTPDDLPDDSQVMLQFEDITVTFDSTVYLEAAMGGEMTVATLDGVSVVGAGGQTRVVQPGAQVTIPLAEESLRGDGPPTSPEPYNLTSIRLAPLDDLPRTVELPAPIVPIVQATPAPTATDVIGCVVRGEWTHFYTVERGDTLIRIAQRYDVTAQELQEANCLGDPNRLSPGERLRVPAAAPGDPEFFAEQEVLPRGECTNIYWTMEEASVVYFQGDPVARTETREACPELTTTYTLLVVTEDGAQTGYTVTITVVEPEQQP